jgi:hypothetical protein
VIEIFEADRQPDPPDQTYQEAQDDVLALVGEGGIEGIIGLVHNPDAQGFEVLSLDETSVSLCA